MIENPADLRTIRFALTYLVEFTTNPLSKEAATELLIRVERLLGRWKDVSEKPRRLSPSAREAQVSVSDSLVSDGGSINHPAPSPGAPGQEVVRGS